MRRTFNLKHAIVIGAVVCLLSLLVGAVLAQEEPDIPEPEVPTFDLTGPAEDAEAPVLEPLIVEPIEPNFYVIEPAGAGIANPSPNEFANSIDPTFSWTMPAPVTDTTGFDFEIYSAAFPLDPPRSSGSPLTSTLVSGNPVPLTPTCNLSTGECAFNDLGFDLTDGRAYYWRVISNGEETSETEATFIVSLPGVAPAPGEEIQTTTPYVVFPQLPGVTFYQVAAYLPPSFLPTFVTQDAPDGLVPWIDWFSAEGTDQFPDFPEFQNGICSDGVCRVRPDIELTTGSEGTGDTRVQIWYRTWDGSLGEWQPLFGNLNDTFTILAPDSTINPTGGPTTGRPSFTVNREIRVNDTLNGLTVTPDYYRIFIYGLNSLSINDQWYAVDSCNEDDLCTLEIFDDNVQDILYNESYRYWIRGYDSRADSYTAWSSGDDFSVNQPRVSINNLQLAGTYERIGSNPVQPFPKASIDSWVPCEGLTDDNPSNTVCDTSRPILHFQPSADQYTGDWYEVVLYDPANNSLPFRQWLNIYEPQTSPSGDFYWYCSENTGRQANGSWAFEPLTCFFQPGELGGLAPGMEYAWYIRGYSPGGPTSGGVFGYTDPGRDGDPNNVASFRVRGENGVEGVNVSLEAPANITPTTPTGSGSSTFLTTTYITGEPTFSWRSVPSATWYNITVRDTINPADPNATPEVYYSEWHQVGTNGLRCDDTFCAFTAAPGTNFFLFNGNYVVEILHWNGALSEPSTENFSVNVGTAQRIEDTSSMIVFNEETIQGTVTPVFQWPHIQNNTWYRLVVRGPRLVGTGDFEAWYRAYDICAPDPMGNVICTVRPDLIELLGEAGNFDWRVDSWSPANQIVTGASASYSLSNASTGVPTAIYPASPLTHTLTNTNTLELVFEPAQNASWYNIFIAKKNSDGTYEEPIVFDWYYLPSTANGYEYPTGAMNTCMDGLTFAESSPVDGACRIIPTELENGQMWPVEIWEDGTYEWWMRAYGPAKFSPQGVVEGWRLVSTFEVDIPLSTPVDQSQIRNQDGILVHNNILDSVTGFIWPRADIAEWYFVQVINNSTGEFQHLDWINREAAGCSTRGGSMFCELEITNNVIDNSAYGTFDVQVGTWSFLNGGFTSPEDIQLGLPPMGELQFATFTKL